MTTLPDLLYVALFALALPLWDYLVSWPAFRRQQQTDPARARMRLWRVGIGSGWSLVAVGAVLWVWNDRSWTSFGFAVPEGWRMWTSIALFLLLAAYYAYAGATLVRSPEEREGVRKQFTPGIVSILPRTRTEVYWFGGVSLTAGFCEEFLFRGYFIWALSPWLGWWGAAALSLLIFASGHAYQGWNGALRTGIVGAIFTLVVAISGSLWPAIALHALLDLSNGMLAWLTLRKGQAAADVPEVETPTETRSVSGVQSSPVQAEPGAAPDRRS